MTIESATHVSDLNSSYPAAGDAKSEGDDHIRLIKTVAKTDVSILSASASTTLSTVTAVSTVAANVSTSLGNVNTSLGNVSTSLGNVSTSLGNVSTSNANVSTSNANVSTSLSATSSTLTAVSSTVAAAGASSFSFVSSQTASASSHITFTGFASGYDYLIEADGVYLSTGDYLKIQVTNGGTPDTGSNYGYAGFSVDSSGGTPARNSGAGVAAYVSANPFSSSSTTKGGFSLLVRNPADTGNARILDVNITAFAGTYIQKETSTIAYTTTTAVDGVKIFPNSGNITAGTFNLYKIARA